jgi:hypothetical protein
MTFRYKRERDIEYSKVLPPRAFLTSVFEDYLRRNPSLTKWVKLYFSLLKGSMKDAGEGCLWLPFGYPSDFLRLLKVTVSPLGHR